MNKSLLIAIAAILFVLVVGLGVLALTQHPGGSNSATTTSSTGFPVSGNSQSNTTGNSSSGKTMTVQSTQGGTITTKDFINNGSTVADQNNSDDYYLQGGPNYCNDKTCPPAQETSYYITYRQSSKAFIIGLTQEPLGQSRQQAEQYLMKILGISQTDMCNLNYYVLTTSDVNSQYAGKNLGFSFCPGAVPLPN